MGKLKKYQKLIKEIIKKYSDYQEPNCEEFEVQMTFDDEHGHYYLMYVGWEDMKRIHTCLLHLDLKGEKIWIQKDFVEQGVATDLMEAGVPKENIVLAFQAPYKRQFTGFAVA